MFPDALFPIADYRPFKIFFWHPDFPVLNTACGAELWYVLASTVLVREINCILQEPEISRILHTLNLIECNVVDKPEGILSYGSL